MSEAIYDTIGEEYNSSRQADPSIVRVIHELLDLPPGSAVADIGAGTGNYSNALANKGYRIHAVEPSARMRSQATRHRGVEWYEGKAEAVPLPDQSVDGVMVTLAVHHFTSLSLAAAEMHRICPSGPIVILTIDPREARDFWFKNYFPEIHQRVYDVFLPLEAVCQQFIEGKGWKISMTPFPSPQEGVDMTMHSGWNRPEIYLDKTLRRNMSGFALADPEEVRDGLSRLKRDLESKEWDRRYGYLRQKESFDLGFRFLRFATKKSNHSTVAC
ncbi:MAG: class I SAM-dependent methyltransferase [Proteobacteria bacterium]|nr:class I SAM-dependent methyltransferase [Pseudomonadota bacterium]